MKKAGEERQFNTPYAHKTKGFSLVELIVVIAIMAILVGILTPTLMKQIEKSRYAKDKQLTDNVACAVQNGLTEEETYEDFLKIADNLPYTIYLSELYSLSENTGAVGYIFAQEVIDEIGGKVKFCSAGIKGKDGFTDKIVKISIDENLNVTVEVEGANKALKIQK